MLILLEREREAFRERDIQRVTKAKVHVNQLIESSLPLKPWCSVTSSESMTSFAAPSELFH